MQWEKLFVFLGSVAIFDHFSIFGIVDKFPGFIFQLCNSLSSELASHVSESSKLSASFMINGSSIRYAHSDTPKTSSSMSSESLRDSSSLSRTMQNNF